MKLYFADTGTFLEKLHRCKAENILISYAMISKPAAMERSLAKIPDANIMIDSGAFSAWTMGTRINLQNYITTAKKVLVDRPNAVIISLDVIPGAPGYVPTTKDIEASAQQGWENYETMKAAGLKPMHIFHQHEDFKWLHKLIDDSEYIGISPANDVTVSQRRAWLDKVFSIVKATRKTHGFGVTTTSLLQRYPWYSADSNSWKAVAMYGHTHYQKKTKGRGKPKKLPAAYTVLVLDKEIKAAQAIEAQVTKLWKTRGVVWT